MPEEVPRERAWTAAGVPLHVHWSVVGLALVQLATAHASFMRASESLVVALLAGVATTVGVLWSIMRHELAHAVAARRRGLDVHGVHLMALGGATSIVEADTSAATTLRVAAAGPWRSLQLAAVCGLASAGLSWFSILPVIALGLGIMGWFNLGLAAFNLLPAAPLDGGRILAAGVWRLTGSRRTGHRVAAAGGVVLGLAMWLLAGWLALRATDVPAESVATLWIGVVWTVVVAAFLSAASVRTWVRATDGIEPAAPSDVERPEPGTQPATTEPAGTVAGAGVHRMAARRGWRLRLAQVAWVGVVGLAGVVVPSPWILHFAGPVYGAGEGLQVDGPTTPVTGEVMVLTVMWWHAGVLPVAWGALSPAIDLVPHGEAVPSGVGDRAWLIGQQALFMSSLEQAAAAALEQAGEPVTTTTRVVVDGLLSNGPAQGLLEAGDIIEALEGTAVTSAAALASATATRARGDVVSLDIERDGTPMTVEVPIGPLPGDARVGLGIRLAERITDVQLPRTVASSVDHLGGPSAGLPTAIEVYDLVAPRDLLRGRRVAATGTMAANGTVGEIGGLRQKVIGAIGADADLLLVPSTQEALAERFATGRVEVRGVASLEEAIAALREP